MDSFLGFLLVSLAPLTATAFGGILGWRRDGRQGALIGSILVPLLLIVFPFLLEVLFPWSEPPFLRGLFSWAWLGGLLAVLVWYLRSDLPALRAFVVNSRQRDRELGERFKVASFTEKIQLCRSEGPKQLLESLMILGGVFAFWLHLLGLWVGRLSLMDRQSLFIFPSIGSGEWLVLLTLAHCFIVWLTLGVLCRARGPRFTVISTALCAGLGGALVLHLGLSWVSLWRPVESVTLSWAKDGKLLYGVTHKQGLDRAFRHGFLDPHSGHSVIYFPARPPREP